MRTPGIVQRHPELRWLASVAVVGVAVAVIASTVSGVFRDDPVLPATNPQQLVSQVQTPRAAGYSGTVVTHADLGLPHQVLAALSAALPVGGQLLAGSHTMRYWYGGAARQRVAVIGQSAEQDIFRTGRQLLIWDTGTRIAQRSTLPASGPPGLPITLATAAALTPPQLAARLVQLAGSASDTTLRSGDPVADRRTYELVIRPEPVTSRIEEVRIEIDGIQSVPLAVQIFTRGSDHPVIEASFTSVSFAEPARQNFSFTPPSGSQIRNGPPLAALSAELASVATLGSGWLAVASASSTPAGAALIDRLLGAAARRVKGHWGTGRLLQSPLFCVLVTDKGRILAGPVGPSVLYKALGG